MVHGLSAARMALAPGLAVTLLSAPGAALIMGAAWWCALLRDSGHAGPSLLDCADAPGRAAEALALGCQGLILAPAPPGPRSPPRPGATARFSSPPPPPIWS
ncbi:hypothetical protein GT370_02085 [Acidocella sp. MX-AZ03]|uniref:hypothetical protein n=1 Tax=Acidocella sp. MX-AZ03 TaxID=2697363 RepID=UPI0022DE70B9|nr:hypothetical protein [Acidocella sp. MX-AZ03]WBO59727.1 hypothetical protein GT370_02085 [Acidocella sp. MX-AZ03]